MDLKTKIKLIITSLEKNMTSAETWERERVFAAWSMKAGTPK